ncbi:Map3k2 [Symbiodinium microadriaticum]|nr:Map3k2 [Symbiodinium microadriaticum]CAE7942426.1 Map3k2 [Symbiodinium sp. KB8]
MSSAASVAALSALSTKTAVTINVHNAGDTSGYVAYGVERVRAWKDSVQAGPYQKVKVHPHGFAEMKARLVQQELCRNLGGLSSPRVSLSPSTTIPESPVPSSEFEDAVQETELHRGSGVSVERRRCRGRPVIFKKYFQSTMPTHQSLQEQVAYELSLYYKDLKGLSNVVQIETHFYDPFHNLTLVFPDLGTNQYPRDRSGITSYMRQMLLALDGLWKREIVHCNIKGGPKPNAIFDSGGKLTLIDFESAVRRHELIDQGQNPAPFSSHLSQTLCYRGNPHYVAPEVMVSQPGRTPYGITRFGRRRDTFSAGVVFAELVLNVHHMFSYSTGFVSDEDIIEAHEVLRGRLSIQSPATVLGCYGSFSLDHSEFNHLASDLIVKMLNCCRMSRPKPANLLQHSLFQL